MDSIESPLNVADDDESEYSDDFDSESSDDDDEELINNLTSRNVADSNSRDSSKDFIGTSPVLDLLKKILKIGRQNDKFRAKIVFFLQNFAQTIKIHFFSSVLEIQKTRFRFGNVTAELPVTNLSGKYEQQALSACGIGG